jgi:hypothetical protein
LRSFALIFHTGAFTGSVVWLISNIRAKHGQKSVNLMGCGGFNLASDLSDIADVENIDLSSIGSLEGPSCHYSNPGPQDVHDVSRKATMGC